MSKDDFAFFMAFLQSSFPQLWRWCYCLPFSFRLKDLGQIKEAKKITIPTATGTSSPIAVLPCAGPSLRGEIRKASGAFADLGKANNVCVAAQAL